MSDAIMLLLGLRAVELHARSRDASPVVPEPEFKPFQLSSRRGAGTASAQRSPAGAIPPANTTRSPRTLQELGVPGSLAREFEGALRAMGLVDGDRIVGFTYRTPDGVVHPLRAGTPEGAASERAA